MRNLMLYGDLTGLGQMWLAWGVRDPLTLAQRFVASLLKLRALGAVADFDIGPECTAQWASLKYARVAAASVAAGVSDTGATD